MKPKYKVTGCARFFIFFLFFVPIVYFGAAYLRGEDGLQKMKDFYHKMIGKPQSTSDRKDPDTYEIKDLHKELDKAKDEIRELKNTIKEKDKEIEKLKSGSE
ncbi:MAG TPA: hypothetical protein VMZ69_01405 [Saprospiraceae bacterium]|nr:hypothetical protein [Saprospiraceae bacterium]